jgi:predicted NBD/HSP70 family sugar kinase
MSAAGTTRRRRHEGARLHGPRNLGAGWVGFDFRTGFGCPVKFVNAAAMQALGSYQGGRLLFLGLGTGLGSAMVVDGLVQPMELAHLPYKKGRTYEDYVGQRGWTAPPPACCGQARAEGKRGYGLDAHRQDLRRSATV